MLDYLCRQDIIVPSGPTVRGRGRARRYTFGDVVMLRAIAGLLKAGVSVARLRNSLIAMRAYHPEITAKGLPARYLVTDGANVYLWTGNGAIESLDKFGQLSFGFVVELKKVQAEVLSLSRKLIPSKKKNLKADAKAKLAL